MTSARASAYKRVTQTVRDLGPAKLWPAEEACIRDAADALLFCHDLSADPDAREAFAAVMVVGDDLIGADRWTPERTLRLLDHIWACGPGGALVESVAA
jgi:hypothetical protein